MAQSVSEDVHFVTYHRFPQMVRKEETKGKYVIVWNPSPNEITYIAKDGSKQVAGNGSAVDAFYFYTNI